MGGLPPSLHSTQSHRLHLSTVGRTTAHRLNSTDMSGRPVPQPGVAKWNEAGATGRGQRAACRSLGNRENNWFRNECLCSSPAAARGEPTKALPAVLLKLALHKPRIIDTGVVDQISEAGPIHDVSENQIRATQRRMRFTGIDERPRAI